MTLPNKGIEIQKNGSIVFSVANDTKDGKEIKKETLIDFTITVEDSDGNKASLPLHHISKLTPAVKGRLLKKPFSNLGNISEPVFQHYDFLLNDFKDVNPQFDSLKLKKIHFQFNLTKQGTILINNIGIRNEK